MGNRFLSTTIRILGITIGVLFIVVASFLTYLSTQKVSLDFLIPTIELALNDLGLPMQLRLDYARLGWNGVRAPIAIRVFGLQLNSSQGEKTLQISEAVLDVAWWPLLNGNFEIQEIRLVGPELTLLRDADGRFAFLTADADSKISGESLAKSNFAMDWFEAWSTKGLEAKLPRLLIDHAAIHYTDVTQSYAFDLLDLAASLTTDSSTRQLILKVNTSIFASGARTSVAGETTCKRSAPRELSCAFNLAGNDPLEQATVLSLWPPKFLSTTKTWISEHLSGGVARHALARGLLKASSPSSGDDATVLIENFSGAFDVTADALSYLPPMPVISALSASAAFDLEALRFNIDRGNMNGLKLSESTVEITELSKTSPTLHVKTRTEGAVSSLTPLLCSRPLELQRLLDLPLEELQGTFAASLELTLPFPSDQDWLQGLAIDVEGSLSKVSGAHLWLGGTPLDLINANLTYKFLDRSNQAVITASQLRAGRTDLTGLATFDEQDGLSIEVTGKSLDLAPLFQETQPKKPATPRSRSTEIKFSATEIRHLWVNEKSSVENLSASGGLSASGQLNELSAKAKLSSGKDLTLEVSPSEAGRSFHIESDDAGGLLALAFERTRIGGGHLEISGELDDANDLTPKLSAEIWIKEFSVLKAPVLLQILTIASLENLKNALLGSQIAFDKFHAVVFHENRQISIQKAEASGANLAITAKDGTLNLEKKSMEVSGVLFPAATISRILSGIPLAGKWLAADGDSGLLGVNYSISGSLDDPSIVANPISALVPSEIQKLLPGLF